MALSNGGSGRPSDERRRALNEELSVPMVSNFFPIERYYDAADKVYDSFQQAYADTTKTRYDDAYVYGKRYCTFCLDAIPTHNYFGATKYKHVTLKHKRQVDQVLTQLVNVCDAMDIQETERQRRAAEAARKQAEEMARIEAQKFAALQQRAQKLSTPTTTTPSAPTTAETVQASAMEKLNLLRQQSQQQQQVGTGRVHGKGRGIKQDPSGEEPSKPSSRYRLSLSSDEDDDDEEKKTNGFPPPLLPPPVPPPPSYPGSSNGAANAPPSYEALTASQRSARYHRTFWAPQVPPSEETVPTQQQQMQKQPRVPIRQLKEEYRTAYVQAMGKGKIAVSGIDTYQGRNGASTNGCTVISALVAARHLNGVDGREITDRGVVDVIDRQCGPILQKIRGKLGLGGMALIIPSDVHDHLVDEKILEQRFFEGAAGGSVCDAQHLGEFFKLLAVGDDGKGASRKAAATFFFHEHVISIVKLPRGDGSGEAYYDLVDSLPRNLSGRSMATRTRCLDIQALQILLRWYTSSKFSEANCQYIDQNPWDDAMADFDPRVFQGFVWSVK